MAILMQMSSYDPLNLFSENIHNLSPNRQNVDKLDVSFASLQLEDKDVDEDLQGISKMYVAATDEPYIAREIEGLDTIPLERSMCDNQDDNDAVNSTIDDSLILRVHSDNEDDTDTRCLANEDKSTMVTETTVSRQEDQIRKENKMLLKLDFQHYKPPPLLSRHPTPAIGRDDDIQKLKEILDDVLSKTDSTKDTSHKILFAPDHKIAVNLMKLIYFNLYISA
ncbi:hypothetical protein MAR_032676 [Mya arenaria]|uniref:Uncharacterized protein n=1 Tax=Mya arenaria TaxID=6604 RepID=A0ABY7F7B2_MYAAR|nr:hypothetical protein MAR_032676 [Mya arenaria]